MGRTQQYGAATTVALTLLACCMAAVNAVEGVAEGTVECWSHGDCAKIGMQCFFSEQHTPSTADAQRAGRKAGTGGFCFHGADVLLEVEETKALAQARARAKAKAAQSILSGLTVHAPAGQKAQVFLGSGKEVYSMGAVGEGKFSIGKAAKRSRGKHFIEVDKEGLLTANTELLEAGALKAERGFKIGDKPQWRLVAQEDFFDKDAASTWKGEKDLASLTTTSCAGIQMLGGHGAFDRAGSVTKTFKELGAHTKVRVTGTFHFIDKWSSQSGFMKMSGVGEGEELKPQYVWTEVYDLGTEKGTTYPSRNACGNPEVGENRFSSPIDVTIDAHALEELTLVFGSTLKTPEGGAKGVASWGVSNIAIYTM